MFIKEHVKVPSVNLTRVSIWERLPSQLRAISAFKILVPAENTETVLNVMSNEDLILVTLLMTIISLPCLALPCFALPFTMHFFSFGITNKQTLWKQLCRESKRNDT
uniref:Uncharacterized protein n=1 Tax=Glossina brevipalpis TaxID=37001 RepID=A0A1A9WDP0_9MUSC